PRPRRVPRGASAGAGGPARRARRRRGLPVARPAASARAAARRARVGARAAVSVRERMRQFEQALRERGLKSTSQRDDIARVFFGAEQHLSIEQLYTAVRRVNPRVGYATVYRTLKLLKECGLAAERHFDDGQARYEPTEETAQHDHIICERCGKVVEFSSQELEKLQARIGRF